MYILYTKIEIQTNTHIPITPSPHRKHSSSPTYTKLKKAKIKAKFDELEAFINRVNTSNPISLICLQECWLDEKNIESIAMFNLKDL